MICAWPVTLAAVALSCQNGLPQVSGDCEIRAPLGESAVVVRTSSRFAGAVESVTWGGREFIDRFDHGRQLQSASNFDAGAALAPETFNPTEAGSSVDGTGPRSSSQLLHLASATDRLQTTTRMAFWLPPGGNSGGNPARNTTLISDHLLTKRLELSVPGVPGAMSYRVTFHTPVTERHRNAVFEVVTGYMPAEFSQFLAFDPATGRLRPLDDGPGEQPLPVCLSTPDGRFVMGCYTPDRAGRGWSGPGYGRFRFPGARVVKWNCVFRATDSQGLRSGDYPFQVYVLVGTREMVRGALVRLHRQPTRRLRDVR